MKKEKIIYRKIFKPGDIVILSNKNKGKLPDEAFDFLLTYKKFKVTEVNDNYNIHVGYFLENGNIYYFSPNRFELMSGKAPLKIKNSEGLYDDITEEELENMKKVLKKNTDDEDEQNEVKKWNSTLGGSTFDTSNVSNFSNIFYGCSNLYSIEYINTPNGSNKKLF